MRRGEVDGKKEEEEEGEREGGERYKNLDEKGESRGGGEKRTIRDE